jgi:hypothetical protein
MDKPDYFSDEDWAEARAKRRAKPNGAEADFEARGAPSAGYGANICNAAF